MNPGSHVFAAGIVEIPASRNSFTSRSRADPAPIPQRTKHTFHPPLRPRAVGADDVDVELRQCATKLRDAITARCVLAVHPEDAGLSL
jgi:hypothetical protein